MTLVDQSDHFSADDLAIFERYFATVLCRNAPNPLAIRSFLRALEFAGPNLQKPEIMRAFMNMMKEEMVTIILYIHFGGWFGGEGKGLLFLNILSRRRIFRTVGIRNWSGRSRR